MTELVYKFKGHSDRDSCLSFLKKSGFWNDIELEPLSETSKKIIITIDSDESEDFLIKAKYKGFRFYEET